MTRDSLTPADVELDPYAIVELSLDRGLVVTHSGVMTIADAVRRFVTVLQAYDWPQFLADREQQRREHAEEFFIGMSDIGALGSLLAEISLSDARQIWNDHVPRSVGTLRMLALQDQTQELAYQAHLSSLRVLCDDAKIDYLLEHGDEMRNWGDARVHLTG